MPQRIIRECIVEGVKPYELIGALMHAQGVAGSSDLARKIGKPRMQPTIHKFLHGLTQDPARTTAEPIAKYFGLPNDAMYDETVATRIARERGVEALPEGMTPTARRGRKKQQPEGDESLVSELLQSSDPKIRELRNRLMHGRVGVPEALREFQRLRGLADRQQKH
jgi:hypothetical protein